MTSLPKQPEQGAFFPNETGQTAPPVNVDEIASRIDAASQTRALPPQGRVSEAALDQGYGDITRGFVAPAVEVPLFDVTTETVPPARATRPTSELTSEEQNEAARRYLTRLDEEGRRSPHQVYDPHNYPHRT